MRRLAQLPAPRILKKSARGLIEASRYATARWRVLPDFVCIGAQKAGTSALYLYLGDHPCVVPSWWKETHFFTYRWLKGQQWYRSHFPLRRTIKALTQKRGCRVRTGEATPYYLYYPWAPYRAEEVVPQAQLIVLLRDPVARAISHYHHEKRRGHEPLAMEAAFDAEPERLAGEAERLLADPEYYSYEHQHHSYLDRGVYVDQLKAWHACFPREQMLVLKSEDLFEDPRRVFCRTLDFLALPGWEPEHFPAYNVGRYPDSEEAVRQRLREYFRPHNERLYAYLGCDWSWEG